MRLRWFSWLILVGPLFAQAPGGELLEAKTLAKLAAMDAGLDGTMGVAVIDLKTGGRLCYHCDTWFPTASTIKVPLLVEVMRLIRAGKLSYGQRVPVSKGEVVPSSAAYERAVAEAGALSVRELITIMIQNSDNSATNKLIDLVGGFAAVNTRMDEMNPPGIRLRRKMIDLAAAKADRENIATPADMARLAEMLYSGKVLDPVSSREILEFMGLVKGDVRKAVTPVGTATKILFDHFRKLDRANAAGRFLE